MFVMPNYNFHMEFKRVSSNCKIDMWQKIESKSELKVEAGSTLYCKAQYEGQCCGVHDA